MYKISNPRGKLRILVQRYWIFTIVGIQGIYFRFIPTRQQWESRPSPMISRIHKRDAQYDIIIMRFNAAHGKIACTPDLCFHERYPVRPRSYTCAFPPARVATPIHHSSRLQLHWPCSSSQEKQVTWNFHLLSREARPDYRSITF